MTLPGPTSMLYGNAVPITLQIVYNGSKIFEFASYFLVLVSEVWTWTLLID